MLSVYAIEQSEIYGHGKRAVIWFSGCSLRCPGCINQHLWNRDSGNLETVSSLINKIKSLSDIAGVTLIGGEPLDQDEDLSEFVESIISVGLDIVLFTGYEPEELQGWKKKVFDVSQVVVCGRYDKNLHDTNLLLRGSSNQRIIIKDDDLKIYYSQEARQVEVTITEDGMTFLGFPEDFIKT
jgi:anaerobic ribonucleoside-triphosphate reductase activating protein